MDDLIGPNVQIILAVIEGQGFGFLHNPIFVTGSLNGHMLQTDSVGPSPTPSFATNLIWQADKKGLRLMRTGNVPMKIECYTISLQNRKERVGYILLSLRSLQIVPSSKKITIHQSWHKLLGVKTEGKSLHPEILFSFYVEDDSMKNAPPPVTDTLQSSTLTKIIPSTMVSASESKNSTFIPRLMSEEGLIQIGPDNECADVFLVSVFIGAAYNLDMLLPESIVFGKDTESFRFRYSIFDHLVQTKPFRRNLQQPFTLNEKIILRLRSSLETLRIYFDEVSLLNLQLLYGNNEIASAGMNLNNLIPTDSLTEFIDRYSVNNTFSQNSKCFLYHFPSMEIPTSSNGRKPYIEIEINLKLVSAMMSPSVKMPEKDSISVNNSKSERGNIDINLTEREIHEKNKSTVTLERHTTKEDYQEELLTTCNKQDSGDGTDNIDVDKLISEIPTYKNDKVSRSTIDIKPLCTVDNNVTSSKSENSIIPKNLKLPESNYDPIEQYEIIKDCNNKKHYHNYCLIIRVESVVFSGEFENANIQFRFHHPWAEINPINGPEISITNARLIPLENMKCSINYVSTPDKINKLLLSWPPKIITYKYNPRKVSQVLFAETEVDITPLLTGNKNEYKYTAKLSFFNENEFSGHINLNVSLNDSGLIGQSEIYVSGIKQSVFNDQIAYKLIEELEEWKDRQQILFKEELARREETRLTMLSTEWTSRRIEQEAKLTRGIEQCRTLSANLSKAIEDFREKSAKYSEAEDKYNKLKESMEKMYNSKYENLKDASRKIDEDVIVKINTFKNENSELVEKIKILERENASLKESLSLKDNKLSTLEKNCNLMNQTEPLLEKITNIEDKLKMTMESKIFFKEEWAKAIREINRLKTEHQRQLHKNKAVVPNLGLQDILKEEESQLQQDQIILNQIRADLDGLHSGFNIPVDNDDDFILAHEEIIKNVSKQDEQRNNLKNGNEINETHLKKLKYLTEERDLLLRTGSYVNEDPIIIKMNNEINSLTKLSKET